MSKINEALIQITNQGLDKIRCHLTGAPYATIESDEIRLALEAEIENDDTVTTDRLVDQWELKALTFNSQALPILRGVNVKSLLPLMRTGHNGQTKMFVYFMTRLLYPHVGSEPLPSEVQRDRMLFAIHMYDTASKWNEGAIAGYVQHLAAIDSFCSMPYWHNLWAFESQLSAFSIHKADKKVRSTFADPLSVQDDPTRVDAVIKYLFELMLHLAETQGMAGSSGNRFAQALIFLSGVAMPHQTIPHFQKVVKEDHVWKAAWERKVNGDKELRIAHSVTMGKNYKPNEFVPTLGNADKMAADLLSSFKKAKESKAKKKADSKPAETKKPADAMSRAFAGLTIDTSAFSGLTVKK